MRPVILASLAALAGCANTPGACDPAKADFFSGISCEASGSFGSRDTTLRSNLSTARANLAADRARAYDANVDAGQAVAAQGRAASALSGLRRQNAALRSRLDAASRRNGADLSAINQQRAELDRLERERRDLERNGANPDAIRDMQRRQNALLDAANSY